MGFGEAITCNLMFIRVHPWKAENMKNHKSSMNRFYSRLGSYSFLKYRGPQIELLENIE